MLIWNKSPVSGFSPPKSKLQTEGIHTWWLKVIYIYIYIYLYIERDIYIYISRASYKEGGEIPFLICHVVLERDYRNFFLRKDMPLRFRSRVIAHISQCETREDYFFNLGNKIHIFTATLLSRSALCCAFSFSKACCLAIQRKLDTSSKDV